MARESLPHRRGAEQRLDTELQFHIEQRIADLVTEGLTPEAARTRARQEFGGVEQVKEACRDERSARWLADGWRDLRVAARSLVRAPVFSVVAILVLTLGLGANIAMFQVLDALVLRALPVPSADQLRQIRVHAGDGGRTGNFRSSLADLTAAQVDVLGRELAETGGLAVWNSHRFNLADAGEIRPADGLLVNGDYFRVLGVTPRLGRLLGPADDQPGCGAGAAVVGERFWQQELGGDSDVLGQTLRLDGHAFEVVGVVPARFFGVEVGRPVDVFIPLCTERAMTTGPSLFDSRHDWWLAAVTRLPAGMPDTQFAARLEAIAPGLFRETLPEAYRPDQAERYLAFGLNALPAGRGISPLRTRFAAPLYLLFAITAMVLLIACANLANLLLARASHREREIAVRLAIGASRARVVRYVAAEVGILAAVGTVLGMVVAFVMSRALVGALGTSVYLDLTMHWGLAAFAAALAAATMGACAIGPALRASDVPPAQALRHGLRTSAAGATLSWRRVLIVSEVALTFVLLVGALLFARTLGNLRAVDLGFEVDGLFSTRVDFGRLPDWADRRPALVAEIAERLDGLPWVTSFAEYFIEPLGGSAWNDTIAVSGLDRTDVVSQLNRVGPAYFDTLGVPLLEGRGFTAQDRADTPAVAVVDQTFSERYLDGAPVIGRTVRFLNGDPSRSYEVVGIVGRTKYRSLKAADEPVIFVAAAQNPQPPPSMSLAIRSTLPPEATASALAQMLTDVSPRLAFRTNALSATVDDTLRIERLLAALSVGFGLLALLLAGVGLYGVIAYIAVQREHEIGIRMVLGATGPDVMRHVVRDTAVLVAAGIAMGLAVALLASRAVESLLFGLEPRDTATYVLALGVLAGIGLLASALPAWRASRTSPMHALRQA